MSLPASSQALPSEFGFPPFPGFSYRFLPDFVAWCFGCYGYMMGKAPWLFLAIGLIGGLGAAAGIKNFKLASGKDSLTNKFLQEDSRYFKDDDVVSRWKNYTTNSKANTIELFSNQPGQREPEQKPKARKKREANVDYCDWDKYNAEWHFQSIIIVAKNETILTPEAMLDAVRLSYFIREVLHCDFDDYHPAQKHRVFCCEAWDFVRMFLEIFKVDTPTPSEEIADSMYEFLKTVRYPADKRFGAYGETVFANTLGGVTRLDETNGYNARTDGVKALLFQYFLPNTMETFEMEAKLTRQLQKVRDEYEHFEVHWETYKQTEFEFNNKLFFNELPKVAGTFCFVVLWCSLGALHTDALNSKPWLGCLGIVSTGMACASGFGVMFWQGYDFETFLVAVPLMALAIGLDDMFILMNAWRNTSPNLPRAERSKRMMMEGGTSIFVTVIMTMIDFVIGTNTPYPAIQLFSDFALWTLAFDFLLQMTIFVSVLVLSHGSEKARHQACLCCCGVKRLTRRNILQMDPCTIICCTYGRIQDPSKKRPQEDLDRTTTSQPLPSSGQAQFSEPDPENENEFNTGKRLVYVYVAPILLHWVTRIFVTVFTITFLVACALFVMQNLELGFHPTHLTIRWSNTYGYKSAEWKYFRSYTDPLRLEVLIDFEVDPEAPFSDISDTVFMVVRKIEQYDDLIWGPRLNRVAFRDLRNNNITRWNEVITPTVRLTRAIEWISMITYDKLLRPRLYQDSETGKLRFGCLSYFQMKDLTDLVRGSVLAGRLNALQRGLEEDIPGFKIYITDMAKVLRVFDQIVNLPSQFVQFVLITVASTVVTALVMIPHPICMFWMSLSSLCIILGTLAGMALWGVGLDPVSLIYVLMAIGATADYVCHCIYVFTIIEADLRPDKTKQITWATIRYRKARHLVGELVAETGPAAVGTTLSIIVLSTAQNYVLESFFKVFFVSVLVGLYFMIVVLPIVLCQFGPVAKHCCEKEPGVEVKPDEFVYYDEVAIEVIQPQYPRPGQQMPHRVDNSGEAERLRQLRLFLLDTQKMADPDMQQFQRHNRYKSKRRVPVYRKHFS